MKAEVPNLNEPAGQYVLKEAAEEFIRRHRRGLELPIFAAPVTELDRMIIRAACRVRPRKRKLLTVAG